MSCVTVTDAALDQQRNLELEIMGRGVNPNPIVDQLEGGLEDLISGFSQPPKWAKRVLKMGLREVSMIASCATLDKVSKEGDTAQAHPVVNEVSRRLLTLAPNMDREDRLAISWNLIHACRSVGFIDLNHTKHGDTTVVRLTSTLKNMLEEHDLWGMIGMNRRPMVVPPVPHTIERPGGYLTDALRHGISHGTWQNVTKQGICDAMNGLQDVPYVISDRTLALAKHTLLPYEHEIHKYAHGVALQVATEMQGRTFWLVVYIDFRGRMYYYCDVLSPQGNDLASSLLRFANGQILKTDDDWYWAKVGIASSCSGLPIADGVKLDKLHFDHRVEWVDNNKDRILAVAEDPLKHYDLWWDGFGKGAGTFKCFSACDAYADALEDGYWDLPIRLDQVSSNLQHTAAATRDEVNARRTNLINNPNGEIHDFRKDICDENRRAWEAGEDDEFSQVFLENEDVVNTTTVAKNPVMIIPYGGKPLAIARKFMGDKTWHNFGTEDEPEWKVIAASDSPIGKLDVPFEDQFPIAMKLASRYRKSLLKLSPTIEAFMKFIGKVVKVAGEDGEAMTITSPDGLVMENFRSKTEERTLKASKCFGDEDCLSLTFYVYTDVLDVRKSITSGPPNFVHFLDALVMRLCIIYCLTRGVKNIISIHDCGGLLPMHMQIFRDGIRKATHAVYLNSPLLALAEQYGVELPEFGDLDIDTVLQSENMFM
tara:strand:+ start:46853 stop:48979 length:2127 start_codon:yes stop_codon:yes gene_type:complete